MKIHLTVGVVLLLAALTMPYAAADDVPEIEADDFDRLHTLIQPCEGESPWRDVKWLTDVTEARRQALAQDKPLVIFTAADGSPLGRT